jgi:hypothetical protein
LAAAAALVACYQPSPATGLPCSPTGECPEGQTCDLGAMTCGGAGGPVDAGADGGWHVPIDALVVDAAPDASTALGPFDDPRVDSELCVDGLMEEDPTLSGDGLHVVFMTTRSGDPDLYESGRADRGDAWAAPRNLDELNTFGFEGCPDMSRDGLTLHFLRGAQVMRAQRAAVDEAWQAPVAVLDLEAGSEVDCVSISGDGESAVIAGYAGDGEIKLYRAVREGMSWSAPVELTGLPGFTQRGPWLDDAGLELWFHAKVAGSGTDSDIYRATRATIDDDFVDAELITELSTDAREADPTLTSDKRYVLLPRNSSSAGDLLGASR